MIDESGPVPNFVGCLALVQLNTDGGASRVVLLDSDDGADGWFLNGDPSAIGHDVLFLPMFFESGETRFYYDPDDVRTREAVRAHEGSCDGGSGLLPLLFVVDEEGLVSWSGIYGYPDSDPIYGAPCDWVI